MLSLLSPTVSLAWATQQQQGAFTSRELADGGEWCYSHPIRTNRLVPKLIIVSCDKHLGVCIFLPYKQLFAFSTDYFPQFCVCSLFNESFTTVVFSKIGRNVKETDYCVNEHKGIIGVNI